MSPKRYAQAVNELLARNGGNLALIDLAITALRLHGPRCVDFSVRVQMGIPGDRDRLFRRIVTADSGLS